MKNFFCAGKGVLLGLAVSLAALTPAEGADTTVNVVNFAFQPPAITINQGDTVTWVQKATTEHTSTSDAGLWDSGLLSLAQTFSQTFATAGNFPYHCTPHASFMKGSVTVKAVAVNQPPSVTITSPANNATLTDTNVTLTATASDPDGTVAKVQFFEGRTLLGEATSSPFQVSTVLPVGTHNLSAQATDNQGATASSSVVTITIALSTPPENVSPTLSLPSKTTDGMFQFTVTGTAGRTFDVQASADGTTWVTIQSIPNSSSVMTIVDSQPATDQQRFYRVSSK